MAFPPLVVSDEIISAAHVNSIRNALLTWPGDVSAGTHNLSDVGALGAVSGAFSSALTAASITVTAAVTGATGVFSGAVTVASLTASGALSAAATSVTTLTASGIISAVAKGHQLGVNGGTAGTKADANVLLYSSSSVNWAGIGVSSSGDMWVRTGLSANNIWRFNSDGSSEAPGWTWDHPAKLGTRYVWFDASHRLLVRANVAPTSDSDGVVIGSQS